MRHNLANMVPGAWRFIKEFFSTFTWKEHKGPLLIVAAALAAVMFFWLCIYLIDFRNIFGISSSRGFWWHATRNRGPVEILQWSVMSLVVIFSGRISGIHQERGQGKEKVFWLLVAATFAMMVMEDAGDPRHIQGRYFTQFFGIRKIFVEAGFFGVMVAPLIYGFLRYWSVPFRYPQTRLYLMAGGLMYAFIASTSLFRGVGRFYLRVGEWISGAFLGSAIPGFFLVDFVMEESVELMAASLFFAGVYIYLQQLKTR